MHAPPGGVQMPQLALQQTCPGGQTVGPHIATQMPEQSAPPAAGSQVSLGSSTQANPGEHGKLARPPQRCRAGVRLPLRFLRRFLAVPESTTMESPRLPSTASRPRRLGVVVGNWVLGATRSRVTDLSLLSARIDEGWSR
jgi:hypothetical protein